MGLKSVKIYTLGCKVNQYDSGWLAVKLKDSGFKLVKRQADFAIVNTCAVTKTALKKDKSMINKARKENPEANIFVIGCWPKTYDLKLEDKKIQIINERDLEKVFLEIAKSFKQLEKQNEDEKKLVSTDRARYFLKIQDGCEQFCSYCIIPFARGKIKSRSKNEIIEEVKLAIRKGYEEIVLTGIHLGLYGKDLGNINLCQLMKEIIILEGLGRIRLSSIEVNEVTEDLIKLIKQSDKVCKHLHIPLQSGCDKILKLMNRPYDTKIFKKKMDSLRRSIADVAITTDVIVGFPGETEKDFKETYDFIKKVNFSRLHVFPFSAHEKTKAFNFLYQVKLEDKQRRANELRKLNLKLQNIFKNKFKRKTVEVLIENMREGKLLGKTSQYIDIIFQKKQIVGEKEKKIRVKKIVKVILK